MCSSETPPCSPRPPQALFTWPMLSVLCRNFCICAMLFTRSCYSSLGCCSLLQRILAYACIFDCLPPFPLEISTQGIWLVLSWYFSEWEKNFQLSSSVHGTPSDSPSSAFHDCFSNWPMEDLTLSLACQDHQDAGFGSKDAGEFACHHTVNRDVGFFSPWLAGLPCGWKHLLPSPAGESCLVTGNVLRALFPQGGAFLRRQFCSFWCSPSFKLWAGACNPQWLSDACFSPHLFLWQNSGIVDNVKILHFTF